MTYRDEAEALRAQLADRDAEIARLRAELDASDPSSEPSITMSAWAGGPASVEFVTSVDGELSADDHGAILSSFQTSLGSTVSPSTVGRSHLLTTPRRSGRNLQVSITPRVGRTEIRLTERFAQLMGGLFGGVVWLGGTGLLFAWISTLGTLDGPIARPAATIGAIAWLGAVWAGARLLYGASARGRVSDDRLVHGSVVRAVRTAIAARPRVRVAASDEGDAPESSAEEARPARAQAAAPRK